jgi:hypothetical protein
MLMNPWRTEQRLQSIVVLFLFLLLGQAVWARPKPKPKGTLQFIFEVEAVHDPRPRSDNYPAVCAWLATQDEDGFPREFRLDLNGDGHPEVFLRLLEHSHFGEYSIFTSRGGRWIYLGYGEYCAAPVRLKRAHSGWHDFSVDVSGSRDRLERRYFRWDPKDKSYDLSYRITIRPADYSDILP